MTGEQDTGNHAGLPLAERAQRGLLAGESELWLWEIMELEFPTFTSYKERERPEYLSWKRTIDAAIRFGILATREEQVSELLCASIPSRTSVMFGDREDCVSSIFWNVTHHWITRDAYRTWRATQPNAPAGSLIGLWLGAAPASSVPALPQGEPNRPESGAAVNKPEKPRLSDKEILALRQQGLSNERIHEEYSVPKGRITRVNKSKGVTPLAPGPKPKVSG